MKRLLLLRHAKSSWHDPALNDFERPLNRRGRAAARIMGDYLVRKDLLPDLILCSAAQRTRETLAFIQDQLDQDLPVSIEKSLIVCNIEARFDTVLVIGHNTGLEELARRLSRKGNEKARKRMALQYPTGAMAVIDISGIGWSKLDGKDASLKRFVCPRDLES
jgi:phosphohistidine phosphatase